MTGLEIADLKQFIAATVSQSELCLREELDNKFDAKIDKLRGDILGLRDEMSGLRGEMLGLRGEMLGGFQGVGEAIEHINERLDRHEGLFNQLLIEKAV